MLPGALRLPSSLLSIFICCAPGTRKPTFIRGGGGDDRGHGHGRDRGDVLSLPAC